MSRVHSYVNAIARRDFSVWMLGGIDRESPGDYAAIVADVAEAVSLSSREHIILLIADLALTTGVSTTVDVPEHFPVELFGGDSFVECVKTISEGQPETVALVIVAMSSYIARFMPLDGADVICPS